LLGGVEEHAAILRVARPDSARRCHSVTRLLDTFSKLLPTDPPIVAMSP
jgi:hypothetical protein